MGTEVLNNFVDNSINSQKRRRVENNSVETTPYEASKTVEANETLNNCYDHQGEEIPVRSLNSVITEGMLIDSEFENDFFLIILNFLNDLIWI